MLIATREANGSHAGDNANLFGMHEGKKLLEALKKAGYSQSDLARAAGIDPAAMSRNIKEQTIGDRAWETVKRGLKSLQIDPQQIRDEPIKMFRERIENFAPLVKEWPLEQVELLRRILESGEGSRQLLLTWIDGRLTERK
jgi:transcriptional regulator with XRE-family HTH domain